MSATRSTKLAWIGRACSEPCHYLTDSMRPNLDDKPNADMISDMKTFTVRDMDRRPAVVLNACDTDGQARIRRRDGRSYLVKAEKCPKREMASLPNFASRRHRLFSKPLSESFCRELDRAIRSE